MQTLLLRGHERMTDIEKAARDAARAAALSRTVRVVYELEAVLTVPADASDEMVRLSVMDNISFSTTLSSKIKRIDCRTFPGNLSGIVGGSWG